VTPVTVPPRSTVYPLLYVYIWLFYSADLSTKNRLLVAYIVHSFTLLDRIAKDCVDCSIYQLFPYFKGYKLWVHSEIGLLMYE